jgi:type IV secretion system protein VirB1
VSALSVAAAMALAAQCVPPSTAALMVGIAEHESGLVPTAIHDNISGRSYFPDTTEQAVVIARSLISIGHASLDLGIAQVTTGNFGWTGLTVESAFNPCRSFAAGSAVLLARYNGNPSDAAKIAYAADVTARVRAIRASPDSPQAIRSGSVFTRPKSARELDFTTTTGN